jgi:hypothetical protein
MRFLLCSIVALCFGSVSVVAQQASVKQYKAPLAGKVVLGDVDDRYNAQVFSLEMPEPDAAAEQEKLREVKEQIQRMYPRRASASARKTSSSVPSPTIAISFIADSLSGIPPDNYTAVSKGNKAITVMNSIISTHDGNTGAFLQRKSLGNFSAAVGLVGSNNYRYDPKVVYDPNADRFICVMLNGTNQYNYIVLAFSQTNDPMGAWNLYKFYGDYTHDTSWFDYPAISITQNEFFLTGNKIIYDSSWQAGFTETLIYQFKKQDGYNADTALTYQIWNNIQYNGKNLRCLYPLNPGDTVLGPSQYFLSNRNFDVANDTVFLVKVPDTIGSSSNTLTVTPVVSSLSYGAPPDARQPDTSATLATNDGRVLGGFIRGNEIQFVSTSVNPANGASSVYHGVISNFNTSPSLAGRLFSIDTLDFGYPNISFSGNIYGVNQSIISFDYSGPHAYPGFGAVLFDGSNYSDMVTIRTGDSSIKLLSQKEQRWGDYSGSQPDWNSVGSVWVEGIYGRKNHSYGDYMAKLSSPYHEGVTSTPPAAPSVLFPNPAMEYVKFGFSVKQEQGFSFVICDIQGRIVDKVLDQFCHDGKNVIQFNIASLVPGTYFLKAIGAKGENIAVHSFVKH